MGSLFHPSWVGLWLCAGAWFVGALAGAMRATLDRLVLRPTRIAPTLCYHVAFTTMLAQGMQLGFFVAVSALVLHRHPRVGFWPWAWIASFGYGSAVGYGLAMRAYRNLYVRALRRSVWEDDEA